VPSWGLVSTSLLLLSLSLSLSLPLSTTMALLAAFPFPFYSVARWAIVPLLGEHLLILTGVTIRT
jgi:hypothetical protein